MRLGATEILLILMIALVVFGSSKLTGLGKVLGTSIREFKEEVSSSKAKDGGDKNGDGSVDVCKTEVNISVNKDGDGSVGEVASK